MPVQEKIQFPVRKGLRSRGKSVQVSPPNQENQKQTLKLLLSPGKRLVQDENSDAYDTSPSKRSRHILRESSSSFLSSPRQPLSPTKNVNIASDVCDKTSPSKPSQDVLYSVSSSSSSCLPSPRQPLSPRKNINIVNPQARLTPCHGTSNIVTRSRTGTPNISDDLDCSRTVIQSSASRRNLSSLFSNAISSTRSEETLKSPHRGCDSEKNSNLEHTPSKSQIESSNSNNGSRVNITENEIYSGSRPLRLVRDSGECYQRTKKVLHTALPAEALVGRETESHAISHFLNEHLNKTTPGSMYVSGAPGTGKTAVILKTIERLQMDKSDHCKVIYANCMGLRNAQEIYKSILSSLLGRNVQKSAKQAAVEIECFLCKSKCMILLVLDEMDSLDSKNQDILYTMFEWPTLPSSKLILIGIANSLDLTDRVLPRLHSKSGCQPTLLHFPPYSRNDIIAIINDRLSRVEESDAMLEPSAVQMCARKVAAMAGDARTALDTCRRAVETVEAESRRQLRLNTPTGSCSPAKKGPVVRKVGLKDILKVVGEASGGVSRMGAKTEQPLTFPLQQTVAICTLILMTSDTGKKVILNEVMLGKFHECFGRVCRQHSVASVDQSEFVSLCENVESRGIFSIKKGRDTRSAKVSLKMDKQELETLLQDKTLMSTILRKGLP